MERLLDRQRLSSLKILLPALLLLAGCATWRVPASPGYKPAPPELSCFAPEFENILNTLVTTCHRDDGDWLGDAQGDATAFAPMLLFPLAKERHDPALYAMAAETAEHELDLIRSSIIPPALDMETIIGFPALHEAFAHTGEARYARWLSLGTRAGTTLIRHSPERLTPFVYDTATVYGTGAYMSLRAYALLGDEELLHRGLELIRLADKTCLDPTTGLYHSSVILDWPQATMMMALAEACRLTGDTAFLERLRQVMNAVDERFRDEDGGYYGHPDLKTKGLSGNNNLTWALLDLYELTGDERWLQEARGTISWILSTLYDPGRGLIRHHWTAQDGCATRCCTGCAFQTLVNIRRYNRLTAGRF